MPVKEYNTKYYEPKDAKKENRDDNRHKIYKLNNYIFRSEKYVIFSCCRITGRIQKDTTHMKNINLLSF